MTNRSKRALELMRMILECEAEHAAKVTPLQKELDSLLPDEDKEDAGTPRSFSSKGELLSGSIASKILEILNAEPEKTFCTGDFLEIGKAQSVRGALHRMASSGQIQKMERGFYRALSE